MYVIFVQFTTSLVLVGYLFDSSGAGGSIDRFRKAAVKKAHYELLVRKINPVVQGLIVVAHVRHADLQSTALGYRAAYVLGADRFNVVG